MKDIQTVLASGGTPPKDFTLHDAGHSFRVAERMHEIVKTGIDALSSFDLTLLLLSAYLHDIGMTPEFKKVDAHFKFLLTGEKTLLSGPEIEALQSWLDDQGRRIVPPLPDSIPMLDRLKLAAELTTYYCRHRHNDWSAEWIQKHLSTEKLGTYNGWIHDLTLLCQSHHFDRDKLKEDAFRARFVGEPPAVVNLRYLALVLRVADILEFDPERTPDVILRHRDIAPESQVYWWKDKEISLVMNAGTLTISARPSSATIHKAILDTVDAIDAELALCRAIAEEFPLDAVPGLHSSSRHTYQWTLHAVVHRDIAPRAGAYEYIDGAFRPDTKKLLSLLSGIALYENPLHAVRELVQNSFDAVSERIAHQRLAQPNAASATLEGQLASQHRVSLRVETIGADALLICTDTGIGMTKSIIRDRVLVSGSGPRHDVQVLERRCKEAGFQLGRSGQFGIGLLSYFMVATRVEIDTLRAQEGGDAEPTAWHFETEGIGSFGELKKVLASHPGSVVRLRLRPEIASDLTGWYEKLRSYLVGMLVHCPCELHLSSPLPGCDPLEFKPGWCPGDGAGVAAKELIEAWNRGRVEGPQLEVLSISERERHLTRDREMSEVEQEFKSRIRWFPPEGEQGTLADGTAQYFIRLPYFDLEGGASLAFLRSQRLDETRLSIKPILHGILYTPTGSLSEAWKGMTVKRRERFDSEEGFEASCQVWISWLSEIAGTVMVHRNSWVPYEASQARYREVAEKVDAILARFLEKFLDSEYAWLNERLSGAAGTHARDCRWLRGRGRESATAELSWGSVAFPAVREDVWEFTRIDELVLEAEAVHIVRTAQGLGPRSIVEWTSRSVAPDKVVYYEGDSPRAVPLWLSRPRPPASRPDSRFPKEWLELCGVRFEVYGVHFDGAVVWNGAHALVRMAALPAWEWCRQTFGESIDPIPHRSEVLSDRAKAASWLLQCVAQYQSQLWDGLRDRDPTFLPKLFELVYGRPKPSAGRRLLLLVQSPGDAALRTVTPEEWIETDDPRTLRKHLPVPSSAEWRLERRKPTRRTKRASE
ncbi:MAG TPA: hypothetical protein VGG72_12515 [Bryobacteraceae bacterium]